MIRTIVLGSCVWVQGLFVGHAPGGLITVRVGDRTFTGRPAVTPAS
jgi:hypothetical protein